MPVYNTNIMIHVQCTCTTQTSLGSRSNVFRMLYGSVWGFIRTLFWRWANAFSFLFQHVWLVIRTRSASSSNAFGFLFERISNASRLYCRSNAFGQKHIIPWVWLEFCWSNIKFLCEKWVRFPVCPLYEAIFCNVNQLGARGLSGIKKRPLVGGWFTTSSIVNSISAIASVHYTEIVSWQEGPLWEVPLYTQSCC